MARTLKEHVALTAIDCMTNSGLTKAELARRMGCSTPHITQTLSGDRNMTLSTVQQVFEALGYEVTIRLRPLDGEV